MEAGTGFEASDLPGRWQDFLPPGIIQWVYQSSPAKGTDPNTDSNDDPDGTNTSDSSNYGNMEEVQNEGI